MSQLLKTIILFSVYFFSLNGLFSQTQEYVDYWDKDQTQLRSKGLYERGTEYGTWLFWYQNGNLMEEANYTRGKLDGAVIRYHENGQISEEGYFKMDVQDSVMNTFYRDGKPISKGYYFLKLEYNKDKITKKIGIK